MDMSSDGTLVERLTNAENHSMSAGRALIALSKDEAQRILATYARIAELEARVAELIDDRGVALHAGADVAGALQSANNIIEELEAANNRLSDRCDDGDKRWKICKDRIAELEDEVAELKEDNADLYFAVAPFREKFCGGTLAQINAAEDRVRKWRRESLMPKESEADDGHE